MINKMFTFIIILSLSSFLLSDGAKTVSNKRSIKAEKNQTKELKKQERIDRKKERPVKEFKKQERINKKKERPEKINGKKNSGKNEQLRLLREEFESRKIEIRKRYRLRMKNLKLEKEKELETLKSEMKRRREEIKNS